MPRVGKSKDKFFVSLPPAMVAELSIKEGDEVEFLKHSDTSFIVAKKSNVVKLLEQEVKASPMPIDMVPPTLDAKEIDLLMKLDTFRYSERTREKVSAMLNAEQKATLTSLMTKKVVQLYRKDPKDEFRYSIPKYIYDKFLYGKRASSKVESVAAPAPVRPVAPTAARQPMQTAPQPVKKLDKMAIKKWEEKGDEGYITDLENKGYLVLKNEAEAASTSAALEDSIKQGLVLGTRAFDKKFYICLRGFINRNAPKIMKIIEDKSVGADEIAAQTSLDVDAVKSVLYILAEKGDVTEVRREIFRAA